MRGAHLLACAILVGTVTAQQLCSPACQNGGECKMHSDGLYRCDCDAGYYGQSCETSVCAQLLSATNGLSLCGIIQASAPCVGDIANGRLCSCPEQASGALCQTTVAPGTPKARTKCERQKELHSSVIMLLNSTMVSDNFINALRGLINLDKLKKIISDLDMTHLQQRECAADGMFANVQCEVRVDNITSQLCYCADTTTGDILQGYYKQSNRPSNCPGGVRPGACPDPGRTDGCIDHMNTCSQDDDCTNVTHKCCMKNCDKTCVPPASSQLPAKCMLSPHSVGVSCEAYMPRWFYNHTTDKCEAFVYGGCGGSDNNFKTVKQCYDECNRQGNPCVSKWCDRGQVCVLEVNATCHEGKCPHHPQCSRIVIYHQRHFKLAKTYLPAYSDRTSPEYRRLVGNITVALTEKYKNLPNFYKVNVTGISPGSIVVDHDVLSSRPLTQYDMVQLNNTAVEIRRTGLTIGGVHYPSAEVNKCDVAPETGRCRAYQPMWFYNKTSGRCEKFIYGGCGGNDNKFDNPQRCYDECNPGANQCAVTVCPEGQVCVLAVNTSCDVGKCSHPAECRSSSQLPAKCILSPHSVGVSCMAYMPRWFYNHTTDKCEAFVYGGCGGSDNNFETVKQCYDECNRQGNPCVSKWCDRGQVCVLEVNATCHEGKCPHHPQCSRIVIYYPSYFKLAKTYLPAYSDRTSPEYRRLVGNITVALTEKYKNFPNFYKVNVTGIWPGSIVVGHEVLYSRPLTQYDKVQLSNIDVEIRRTGLTIGGVHYPPAEVDKCDVAPEPGSCRANEQMWFYNKTSGRCENFIYRGCGGNDNRFADQQRCYDECNPGANQCAVTVCPEGQVCVLAVVNTSCDVGKCSHPGECRLTSKPGDCPLPSGVGVCDRACRGDKSCAGEQKCCSNGCGTSCQDPFVPGPGECVIPREFRGDWYSMEAGRDVNTIVNLLRWGDMSCVERHIHNNTHNTHNVEGKNVTFLMKKNSGNCFVCVDVLWRTKNILQYRQSDCYTSNMSIEIMCPGVSQLPLVDQLATLFRKTIITTNCKSTLKGKFQFSYEVALGGGGVCNNTDSTIIALQEPGSLYVDNEVFRMKYERCPEIQTSLSKVVRYHCMGSWNVTIGSAQFMFAAIADLTESDKRERFKCLMTSRNQQNVDNTTRWVMSQFATCDGLHGIYDGPIRLTLKQIPRIPAKCKLSPHPVGVSCLAYMPRWFYNHTTDKCEAFVYGGCGGSDNNFKTVEQCYDECNKDANPCEMSNGCDRRVQVCVLEVNATCHEGKCPHHAQCSTIISHEARPVKLRKSWLPAYGVVTSPVYKKLTHYILESLTEKYETLPNFHQVNLTEILPGSLVIRYLVLFSRPLAQYEITMLNNIGINIRSNGLTIGGVHYFAEEYDPNEPPRAPRFLIEPEDKTILGPASEVYLEAHASGIPRPTYKWMKITNSVTVLLRPSTDPRYTLTHGRLTIRNQTSIQDEGVYQIRAENSQGAVLSQPVQLSFGVLGEFSNIPLAPVVANGYEGVQVPCPPILVKPAATYNWYKNSMANFIRPQLTPHVFISNNGQLYFSEVTPTDEGKYYCIVSLTSKGHMNDYEGKRATKTGLGTQLQVRAQVGGSYPPVILDDFISVFPRQPLRGQDVHLECFAYGTLPLVYSWSKLGGQQMPADVRYDDHNRRLTIPNVQPEDQGSYQCRVSGSTTGQTDSKSFSLTIESEPYFTTPLEDKQVDVGSQVTLSCMATGTPFPTYRWYKNGQPLLNQSGVIMVVKHTVTIYSFDKTRDSGMYQCAATNQHGSNYSTGQLSEKAKPGNCPRVNSTTVGICLQGCSADSDCSGIMKCCSNGCGHTCQYPVNDTETSKCELQPETGLCRAYQPMWFYNKTSGRCEKFIYGGCGGNDNKFDNPQRCYDECNQRANPCVGRQCGPGQMCGLDYNTTCDRGNCSHWAQCRLTNKQGVCPSMLGQVSSGGDCLDKCSFDHHCMGEKKCCDRGCGRVCVDPDGIMNTCNNGQWMCRSVKKCVAQARRCDGNNDCGDMSDEHNCTYSYNSTDLAPCTGLLTTKRDAFTDAIATCVQPMASLNMTIITAENTCRLLYAGLACARNVLMKHKIACTYREFHVHLTNYMALFSSNGAPNTFPSISHCAANVPSSNSTVKTLCEDSHLTAVMTSASICGSYGTMGLPPCSIMPAIVSCMKSYIQCPSSHLTWALINNTNVFKETHNVDFSSCPGPSGRIYMYYEAAKIDMPWQADLYNPNSYYYQVLKRVIEKTLNMRYVVAGGLERVIVTGFWPGSTGFNYTLEFDSPVTNKVAVLQSLKPQLENDTIVINGNTYKFIITASAKPGNCLRVNSTTVGICLQGCSADSDCSGIMKCCSNGCGHTCQYPVNDTDGTCFVDEECANGGTCYNGQCMCAPGYIGTFCRHMKDPCSSNPCENGGSCETPYHRDNYTCTCPPGTSGLHCQNQACDLFSSTMCMGSNSTCVGGLATGELCRCQNGRRGLFCEEQGYEALWGCEMQLRLATYLEKVVTGDPTVTPPPLNYNKVASFNDTMNRLGMVELVIPTCSADTPSEYTSPSCDMNIYTRQKSCYCVNKYGLMTFNSTKVPASQGPPDCTGPCDNNPCQHGGTCEENSYYYSYNSTFYCRCREGFMGDRCQTSFCNQLPFNPCGTYGAQCIANFSDARLCDCSTVNGGVAMTGVFCDTPGDDSQLTWCQRMSNLSIVTERILTGSHYLSGFNMGPQLMTIMSSFGMTQIQRPVCDSSGEAVQACDHYIDNMNTSKCYCTDAYGRRLTGSPITHNKMPEYCPQEGEECYDNTCQHNGSCVRDADRGYCVCSSGYTGKYCQRYVGNVCDSNPCQNGFACTPSNYYNGDYSCDCPSTWGRNCENLPDGYCNCGPLQRCIYYQDCQGGNCRTQHKCVNPDYWSPCDRRPCNMQGRCVESGGTSYVCECKEGYTGIHCKTNSQVCGMFGSVNICGSGTCVGDIADGMLCRCPLGLRGAFCDQPGDAVTKCQRQSDLYTAALDIINGTQSVPGLQNASSIVQYITQSVMQTSEITLVGCSASGDFNPQQCAVNIFTFSQRCFCVNSAGIEVYQNVTMMPGQPPCTSPDPTDIAKLLCGSPVSASLCLNGGTCVGEMDSTPKLCACAAGYEGIMCERNSQPGEPPAEYTMCTFNKDMYNLLKAIMSGNLSVNIMGVTIDQNLLMSSYYQMMMASMMPDHPITVPGMPDNPMEVSNTTGSLELAVVRPNCTDSGEFAALQCEYGMMSGERHACYCYSRQGKIIQGTRTMAPDYPTCTNISDTCEKPACPFNCTHGYRKNILGCDICECKDLCDGRMCPHGTRCVERVGRGECVHTRKRGMCPVDAMPNMDSLIRMFEDTQHTCDMDCRDDADCEDDKKCCGACGNKCVNPYMAESCSEKKTAMQAHWDLYQNMTAFLSDKDMTSMANRTFPAVLHSAIMWVRSTTMMWKPSCTADGDYTRIQCEYDLRLEQKVHCFCADDEGHRINGTDTRPPIQPQCTVKPGYCPMATSIGEQRPDSGNCRSECTKDYDCDGHDKCCTLGCSSLCSSSIHDTIQEHTANISALFRSVCGSIDQSDFCEQGSACVGNWTTGDLCQCPDGYKGPFCKTMMRSEESAPSVCQKRKAIYAMVMDPQYSSVKEMFLQQIQQESLVFMKASCMGEDFKPEQCDHDIKDNSRKWCYCVDASGNPIPGSQVPSTQQLRCGVTTCDVGHPLFSDGEEVTILCDMRDQRCPSGYQCQHVAYGKQVCCINQHGHKDICKQASNSGESCGDELLSQERYYYNSTLKKCMMFRYRGCSGNDNNFMTEEQCKNRCHKKEKPGTCPKIAASLTQRYCQHSCDDDSQCSDDKKCCQTSCGRKCALPRIDNDNRKCRLGVEYKYPNGTAFYCGRGQSQCPDGYLCDVDPADRQSFCCPDEDEPLNICHQPKDPGPCRAAMPRYFYNKSSQQCEMFIYGGCQANDNNFESLEECCRQCGREDTQCKPGECPNPTVNYLLPCADKCGSDGDCRGSARCCYNGCGKECMLPQVTNMTANCHTKLREAKLMLGNFNMKDGCPMIPMPRCNMDGSWKKQQCLDGFGFCWCVDAGGKKIPNTLVRGYTDCSNAPTMAGVSMDQDLESFQVCPADTGINCCNPNLCQLHTCPANPMAVCRINPCNGCRPEFFNHRNEAVSCTDGLSQCEAHRHQAKTARMQHAYNMLPSPMTANFTEVMRDLNMPKPPEATNVPEKCQTAPETGHCRGRFPKWFYNHMTNRCEKFTYGGCKGNDNRFETVEECYKECQPKANPCVLKECGPEQECALEMDLHCDQGKCGHWPKCRYVFEDPHMSGVDVPSCQNDGYSRMQCHHGYCWCVHEDNTPIPGILTMKYGLICNPDGTHHIMDDEKQVKCSRGGSPNLDCVHKCQDQVCPGKPNATCVVNLCSTDCDVRFMEGNKEVSCGDDVCQYVYARPKDSCEVKQACPSGNSPRLCKDMCKNVSCSSNPCAVCKMDMCTCEAKFTDILTGEVVTDCEAVTHSLCEMDRCQKKKDTQREMMMNGETSMVVPTCTDGGHYESQQCHNNMCWCVDGVGQWLKSSSPNDMCGWNETVSVDISMKFDVQFSRVRGRESQFEHAVTKAIKKTTGIKDAENYIRNIEISEGSILVKTELGDKEDTSIPSPEVALMADILQNRIRNGEMTVEFEGEKLTADPKSYSRFDRFEQQPPPVTAEPHPEPEPTLETHEIIIIAVVCGIGGIVLIGVLIKCCCCGSEKKHIESPTSSNDYINQEKNLEASHFAISNPNYDVVKQPISEPAYTPDGDFIKIRL